MRSNAMPKVYHSFVEFERDELYRLDSMAMSELSIDEMLDDMFGGNTQSDESDPLGEHQKNATKNATKNNMSNKRKSGGSR